MRLLPVPISALLLGGLTTLAVRAQENSTLGAAPSSSVQFLGQEMGTKALRLGQDLYAVNCATCHGADLEGQPNWKRRLESGRMPAPPHDASGHTWHHPDQDLFLITSEGLGAIVPSYESDMPAFDGVLTREEIRAVLAFIKSTWPEREREFQAEVTRNAAEDDGS